MLCCFFPGFLCFCFVVVVFALFCFCLFLVGLFSFIVIIFFYFFFPFGSRRMKQRSTNEQKNEINISKSFGPSLVQNIMERWPVVRVVWVKMQLVQVKICGPLFNQSSYTIFSSSRARTEQNK